MLTFILGVPLCIIGSWGSNMSQIILKMFDNERVRRQIAKEEPVQPLLNFYDLGYWGCYLGALGFDLTSQIYLTQIIWCSISALDVMWYKLFSWYWFNDILETLEIGAIGLFITGCLFTTFWEPISAESTMSGFREYTNSWAVSFEYTLGFHTVSIGSMVCVYYYLYQRKQKMQNDPENFPPGWTPAPFSSFNCAGIFVNGTSTALFALTMYILSNTYFVTEGVPFVFIDVVYAACLFFPCFCLSFGTDWWCAANLHNITQVPATLMVSTLFQIATNFAVWGIYFDGVFTGVMWSVGVSLEALGLIAWIGVQQYRVDRDDDKLDDVTAPTGEVTAASKI
jgi:hypothetical protein